MESLPMHIKSNLSENKDYYSMNNKGNILRCKEDTNFLGDCMVANENLIWHSIHKYIGNPEVITKNFCMDKDDILQLGRLGFIKAVKAFDTDRRVKFSSFAVTAIVREVRCYIRDSANIIRPTRTANELINRINRVEKDLGYLPNVEQIAELLDVDESKIVKALQIIGHKVKYLDEPLQTPTPKDQSGVVTHLDSLQDDADVEDSVIDKVYVENLLEAVRENLSKKEFQVLRTRLGEDLNQTETAKKEDISQMKVSRIMKKVANLLNSSNQLER